MWRFLVRKSNDGKNGFRFGRAHERVGSWFCSISPTPIHFPALIRLHDGSQRRPEIHRQQLWLHISTFRFPLSTFSARSHSFHASECPTPAQSRKSGIELQPMMSLLTELENPLIRISTNMPARRAFKKLCASAFIPIFPSRDG
jgi:hypothetical protein